MTPTLALLVGSNPLPNYLAATVLKRELGWETVVLFYSSETAPVKDRLGRSLLDLGSVDERYVPDAGDAESVRSAWRNLSGPVHLHYTGGTKAMAVHLFEAWSGDGEASTAPQPGWCANASYLDERAGAIRFADGTERPIDPSEVQLDLEFLAALHGLERLKIRAPREEGPRLPADLAVMRDVCLADPERATELYEALPDKARRLDAAAPIDLPSFGLDGLSATKVPEEGWSSRARTAWWDFLRGIWLEIWLGDLVRSLIDPHPVWVGVEARRDGRPFEVDVVAIRGHRLYVLSCTTALKPGRAKTKLFEAAFRARQLGGDLARAAIASLCEKSDDVQKDVAASWDSTNVPKAFGLQHLRDWQAGRTESLRGWLES